MFRLRALLFSVRPQLIEKGDLFEDTWGTLAALKTQATANWCARSRLAPCLRRTPRLVPHALTFRRGRESVKTRLRNDLNLSLGDINGLRQRLSPASELALVAFPPVDVKARRAAAALPRALV